MPDVELQGVRKVYAGGVVAIEGLDLKIEDGELLALLGPSGCGKSTLLRLCAGLETLTAGDIRIGGRVVNGLEPGERDIAMVFQNYALYPHMTVRQNLAYGLKNRRTPGPEIDRRIAEAARILQIEELLDRQPRQLSGGQRQRVAMGRAIVREPQVFLYDEPLSNLDAKLRAHARLELKKLQQTLGTTSLYVTHDQVEAMTMADRLVVMNAGVAQQVGRPMEVYARPETAFVAGFIGSPAMNFTAGTLGADRRSVALAGTTVALGTMVQGEAGSAVTLGIRPEHLLPTRADGQDAIGVLEVALVEPLGADLLVHGRLFDETETSTVRLPGSADARRGDVIPLAVNPADLHVFDAASGRRLHTIDEDRKAAA